jgi:hypothetical protein
VGDIFANWTIILLKYINTLGGNPVVFNMNADDQQNKMHPILIKFQNFAKKLFHPG